MLSYLALIYHDDVIVITEVKVISGSHALTETWVDRYSQTPLKIEHFLIRDEKVEYEILLDKWCITVDCTRMLGIIYGK